MPAARQPTRANPPEPDQPTKDPAEDPTSQEESPDSSLASSAATEPVDFFEDPGAPFEREHQVDPERAAQTNRPGEPSEQELIAVGWDRQVVRELLETAGLGLHEVAGKGADDWVFTERELRAIAPPLTRILNRYPITAAAGAAGDEVALLIGLGGYTIRSVRVRARAIQDQESGAAVAPLPGIPPVPVEHAEGVRLG